MGLRDSLLLLERRYAWGVIAFVSGTALGVVGLYYALHERRPIITVQIVSQFDILDVRQSLQDLTILFQGNDIQRSNLNLRALHVRFTNEGEADLLQSHYDQSVEWGLKLRGGRILKVHLLESSSPYLSTNLSPMLLSDTVIRLRKLILEPGRHFTLDILVLHPKISSPTLSVIGKIAGIDNIPVSLEPASSAKLGIWTQALAGSVWSQAIRLSVYSVAGVLVLVLAIGSAAGVSSTLTKRTRRRRAREIRLVLDTTSPHEVLARDILVDVYSVGGTKALIDARSLIGDPKFLDAQSTILRSWDDLEMRRKDRALAAHTHIPRDLAYYHLREVDTMRFLDRMDRRVRLFAAELGGRLREAKLLEMQGDAAHVHPAFSKLLSASLDRLACSDEKSEDERSESTK